MLKKERIEKARALIDRQMYDTDMSAEDTATFNELTGWDFKRYQRIKNTAYKNDTRCVAHYVENDGVSGWAVWSWRKAISDYSGPDVYQALRAAVVGQIGQYSVDAASQCAACGSTDFLSIDHKTTPFKVLADAFVEAEPALVSCLINGAEGGGWLIGDALMWHKWNDFHLREADYQVLCRSCNSKKGAHHAIR